MSVPFSSLPYQTERNCTALWKLAFISPPFWKVCPLQGHCFSPCVETVWVPLCFETESEKAVGLILHNQTTMDPRKLFVPCGEANGTKSSLLVFYLSAGTLSKTAQLFSFSQTSSQPLQSQNCCPLIWPPTQVLKAIQDTSGVLTRFRPAPFPQSRCAGSGDGCRLRWELWALEGRLEGALVLNLFKTGSAHQTVILVVPQQFCSVALIINSNGAITLFSQTKMSVYPLPTNDGKLLRTEIAFYSNVIYSWQNDGIISSRVVKPTLFPAFLTKKMFTFRLPVCYCEVHLRVFALKFAISHMT